MTGNSALFDKEAAKLSLKEYCIRFTEAADGILIVRQDIDISRKNLRMLPDWSGVIVDGSFSCSANELTSLTGLPKAVKELWCIDDHLTALPPVLPEGLRWLKCTDNRITALPAVLPEGLQKLNCSHNHLTMLPPLPRSLTSLDCRGNPLQSLHGIHPSFAGEALTPFGTFYRFADIPPHLLLRPPAPRQRAPAPGGR